MASFTSSDAGCGKLMSKPVPSVESLSVLRRQFVLSEGAISIPPDWRLVRCGGWILHHHESLPVVRLTGDEGDMLGWVLGWPILGTSLCEGELSVGDDTWEQAEATLYQLGGCWLAIVIAGQGERVYLDPIGSMPCVFGLDRRLLGSSTSALVAAGLPGARDDELERALNVRETYLWYPFGLTALRDARRLVPNHYLNLGRWSVTRHWPGVRPPSNRPHEDVVANVLSNVRCQIQAITSKHEVYLPLTAGRDSRMLLACARPVAARVATYTMRYPGDQGQIDARLAPQVARAAGVQYQLRECVESAANDIELWLFRVGDCVFGRWPQFVPTGQLTPRRVHLGGHGGEIARGYYWRKTDVDGVPLTANDLLERLHMPSAPALLRAAAEWLSDVPLRPEQRLLTLDLLYIEQRLGCWAAPQKLGYPGSTVGLSPMNHRNVVEAMLSLDAEYKRAGRLQEDVTRLAWPELLQVPYNAPRYG